MTAAHYARTRKSASGVCLVISDTTEIDYGYKSNRPGLGRLTASNRRGFFLHSALVVDSCDGQVIGLGAQELYTRSTHKLDRVKVVKGCKRATESEVWGRLIDRVGVAGDRVRFIHVCDRGADNFDVFAHCVQQQSSWVIRAAQLSRKVKLEDGQIIKLKDLLDRTVVVGAYQVYVAANRK